MGQSTRPETGLSLFESDLGSCTVIIPRRPHLAVYLTVLPGNAAAMESPPGPDIHSQAPARAPAPRMPRPNPRFSARRHSGPTTLRWDAQPSATWPRSGRRPERYIRGMHPAGPRRAATPHHGGRRCTQHDSLHARFSAETQAQTAQRSAPAVPRSARLRAPARSPWRHHPSAGRRCQAPKSAPRRLEESRARMPVAGPEVSGRAGPIAWDEVF